MCAHAKKGSRSQLHFEPLDDYFTTFLGALQCVHALYAPDCTKQGKTHGGKGSAKLSQGVGSSKFRHFTKGSTTKVLLTRPKFAQSIRSPYKLFRLFPHYAGDKGLHLLEFETVWGVRVDNSSLFALVFKYFRQVMGQALLGHFHWGWVKGSTITVIMPMSQASTCGWVRAKGPTRSAPKQWKLDVHVKSYNPVSATSPLSKSKKEKIIKSGAISKERVSVHWQAQCQAKGQGTEKSFSTVQDSNQCHQTHCNSP